MILTFFEGESMRKFSLHLIMGTALLCAGTGLAATTAAPVSETSNTLVKPAPYAAPVYHGQLFDKNNQPVTVWSPSW